MTQSKVKVATSTKKVRDNYIDALKGFSILLVVMGHSLQTYSPGNFDNNIFFRIIYSFHMPFFMFLSGVVASYSSKPMNLKFITNKFYSLVIPFISWAVVAYYITNTHISNSVLEYTKSVIKSPDMGLWFLLVLFLNYCCLSLIKALEKYVKLYAYLIVWFLIYCIPEGRFGIGLVKWHLPFFLLGYLLFRYKKELIKYRKIALYTSAIVFPLLVLSWHRTVLPSAVIHLEGKLDVHSVKVLTFGELISVNLYQWALLFYRYIVPIAGIGFTCWLFQTKLLKHTHKFLAFIGIYTLDIYVSHFYFLRFGFGKGYTLIISAFFAALSLSLLLGIFVLRKINVLNILFLGGRK